jgi:hypothetical protein
VRLSPASRPDVAGDAAMAQESDDPPPTGRETLLLAQQAIAQSLVLAMQNAVAAQQMMNTLTVAIATRVAGENADTADSGLRAALDVLRGQDPVAQMRQLAELVRQMQEIIAPLAKAPPA